MQSTFYNFKSLRASKSRLGIKLSGMISILFVALAIALIVVGIVLLFLHISWGWLVASLCALPIIVYEWHKGDLEHPICTTNSIDGLLDGDILGKLGPNPSPKEVAAVASSVRGGRFFASRFGITLKFLQDIVSAESKDMEAVWQRALEVRQQSGSEYISGAVLVVALFQSFPDYEKLLAHMHLEMEDMISGVRWYEHFRLLINKTKEPRRTGGIARDFSFGYTPLLKRFGTNLSEHVDGGLEVEVASHVEALRQLIDTFGSGGRQNAALVGAEGAGKS
ncbi:ATP-dependent Clp protease ATP-binding subunit, partial [Candidatus Saccharibacteria bacterium]|nr:ATP-dependent Clp protease ATP-binding subunit [Candidatus Saccharibacteria bacterium]